VNCWLHDGKRYGLARKFSLGALHYVVLPSIAIRVARGISVRADYLIPREGRKRRHATLLPGRREPRARGGLQVHCADHEHINPFTFQFFYSLKTQIKFAGKAPFSGHPFRIDRNRDASE